MTAGARRFLRVESLNGNPDERLLCAKRATDGCIRNSIKGLATCCGQLCLVYNPTSPKRVFLKFQTPKYPVVEYMDRKISVLEKLHAGLSPQQMLDSRRRTPPYDSYKRSPPCPPNTSHFLPTTPLPWSGCGGLK